MIVTDKYQVYIGTRINESIKYLTLTGNGINDVCLNSISQNCEANIGAEVVGLRHLPFPRHFLSLILYPSESHPNPSISLSHCMLSLFHMRDSTVIEDWGR